MSRVFTLATALLILLSGCLLTGCNEWGIIRPKTELRVNPITKTATFVNTKDVDSKLEDFRLEYGTTQPADGPPTSYANVYIKKWDVTDTSSTVIKENVEQMRQSVEQMKQTNEMIKSAFAGLRDIADSFVPILGQLRGMSTELAALKNSTVGADVKAIIREQVVAEVRRAATQPANTSRGDAASQ